MIGPQTGISPAGGLINGPNGLISGVQGAGSGLDSLLSVTPSNVPTTDVSGIGSLSNLQGTVAANTPAVTSTPSPNNPNTSTSNTGGSTLTPQQSSILTSIAQQLAALNDQSGSNASQAAGDLLNGPNGILSTRASLQSGQNSIDQQNIQSALAKSQGLNGVLNMVSHGIQSGGVTLANDNASNSSAAEALARAYGIQGRDAASQVGNQYAQDQSKVAAAQANQDLQSQAGVRSLTQQKADAINSIVNNATSQLQYLENIAATASAPDAVNIAAQQQQIRQNALAALSQYDSQIASATPTAMSPDQIAAQAQSLATAGTAAAAPYNYTAAGPAQLQNTGPFSSELPIFTAPVPKKTT